MNGGYLTEFPGTNNYDGDLGWLIMQYKKLLEQVDGLDVDVTGLQTAVKKLQDVQAQQGEIMDDIVNGKYFSQYVQQLAQWIDANLQVLVGRMVKYVFFGLTSDGHFAAYVPQSWDFITFDTIMTQGSELWGHLVLRW